MREMWMKPVPDGDTTRITVPSSLQLAIGLCAVAVVAIGILPNVVGHFSAISNLLP
jgi:NADH-quinone oxidoreductase subunit N